MPEEVLFESESASNREEVATYLRTVANRLDGDETMTLSEGDQSIELDPPADLEFEVKVERETGSGPDELGLELELEWDDVATGDEPVGDKQTDGLDIS
jgi:amphi-Trp domain-containing protein